MNDQAVTNVQQLFDTSAELYNDVVCNKADTIIDDLDKAITILSDSWKGADAGVQINNVVGVFNSMLTVRNALANLAKSAQGVAADYREIQLANRAQHLEALEPINVSDSKPSKEEYVDTADTININNDSLQGKELLDAVVDLYDDFKASVESHYNDIMGNWTAGDGRDVADEAFNDFMVSSKKYKEVLADVSNSIAEAIKNYQR